MFASQPRQVDSYEIEELRPDKKTEALLAEAVRLHKQLDRYAYAAPPFRFTEQDID